MSLDIIQHDAPAARYPGQVPLPGYRLLSPLGRGGFGDVWKCEAPGGLQKAIKFVATGGDGYRQELSAFEKIKQIRHPFLLTLERVEVVGHELAMVMELADGQFLDRCRECRATGLPGIPHDELVGYMMEAAEALDMMGSKYGLQHLDVKPENLFLVSGHAKVGDYGLVRRADLTSGKSLAAGFTPKYTSPEVLDGSVDMRTDQYSLALVYVEMLTGEFPYSGRTAAQLLLQHVTATPDLSRLPEVERPIVGRALSKDPAGRYPSCLAFVKEIADASRGNVFRFHRPTATPCPSSPTPVYPYPTQRPSSSTFRRQDMTRMLPEEVPVDPFGDLATVMEVTRLHAPRPRDLEQRKYVAREFVEAIIRTATGEPATDETVPEGIITRRFLSTLPSPMVPYKLAVVGERWNLELRQPNPTYLVFRRTAASNLPKGSKLPAPPPAGFEVIVRLAARPSAEVTIMAEVFGSPDPAFTRTARSELPLIMEHIRGQLQNIDERRAHPRYPTDMAVTVYPLYPDGQFGPGIAGQCLDVSLGGLRFHTTTPIQVERLFVEFPDVKDVRGLTIYIRSLRTWKDRDSAGHCNVGRFRLPD